VQRRFLGLLISLALSAVVCEPAGPAYAEDASVTIDNFTFDPPVLTVKAGASVTFTNRDDIPHTVVATNKAFRSRPLDTGDKFSFTFTAPGTYDYFCSLHPHMKAQIVVEPVAGK
jgi:amicyanin